MNIDAQFMADDDGNVLRECSVKHPESIIFLMLGMFFALGTEYPPHPSMAKSTTCLALGRPALTLKASDTAIKKNSSFFMVIMF